MALRPAYGFRPYGFRGLPDGPTGFGESNPRLSRFVVVHDRYGDKHAAELAEGERPDIAARVLAEDLGLDQYDVQKWSVVRARDAGAARLMGLGEQLSLFESAEEVVVSEKPRRRGVSRKPGRAVKCKNVKITLRNGKRTTRKLCWDKHGVLTSNKSARADRRKRKVVCKRKCAKGRKAVCVGGYRSVKGTRVCKKFVCRRRGA